MAEDPGLPDVDQVVDDLTREVVSTRPSADTLWHVYGAATGGKTSVLRRLADRLAEEGLAPILVQPPARALDAGPLALVEAVGALGQVFLSDGAADRLTSQTERWSGKLGAVTDAVRAAANRVVVLCDEPGEWPSNAEEDVHFAEHAREAAIALLSAVPCRRVVAGAMVPGMRTRHTRHLAVSSDPSRWLRSAETWGSVAGAARELAERSDGALARRSPLEIRLLVALLVLQPAADVMRWWATGPSRRDVSRRLAQALSSAAPEWTSYLRGTWSKLSLVRRPMGPELLQRLAGDAPTPEAEAIVHNCLLYQSGGRLVLHWILTLDVRDQGWLDGGTSREIHGVLARYYKESFDRRDKASDPTALLDEVEAFHHAALSGDPVIDSLRPYFADQLNVLGRSLSRDFREYRRAAEVFRRACAWEPADDYAHHYLAYNLNIAAEEAAQVEEHYREAIRLRAGHAWWHSRWVSYLLTRGRTSEARRAWDDALDALGLPDPGTDAWIYENLHVWIARLLLHRGQLDFATRLLDGIPPKVLDQHHGLSALARRLRTLVEARRVGATFPMSIPPEQWWNGPHLCPRRREGDKELRRWLAGRADQVAEDRVHMQVAEPPAAGAEPVHGFLELPVADFDRWTGDESASELSAGRFVELAWYGCDVDPLIRVHRQLAWEDRDLPPLSLLRGPWREVVRDCFTS